VSGPEIPVPPGKQVRLGWRIPPDAPHPIHEVGVRATRASATPGTLHLDWLDWHGEPAFRLEHHPAASSARAHGWVDAVDHVHGGEGFIHISQDHGIGLLSQGTRDWRDYTFRATVTIMLADRAGIAVRHQGRRRYYALLLTKWGTAQLAKVAGTETVLAEVSFPVELYRGYRLSLAVRGAELIGEIDGVKTLAVTDLQRSLPGGGVALICEQGTMAAGPLSVEGGSHT
jgi:hypothetical protein